MTTILPVIDENGSGTIELPVLGSTLGYASFRAFSEDGISFYDLPNIPASSPPVGLLPAYDSDGVSVVASLAFEDSLVGSIYEELCRRLETAVGNAAGELGWTVVFQNADDSFGLSGASAERSFSFSVRPVSLSLLSQSSDTLLLRVDVDAVLVVRVNLESGCAEALLAAENAATMFASLSDVRVGVCRVRRLGLSNAEQSSWGVEVSMRIKKDASITKLRSRSFSDGSFTGVVSGLQQDLASVAASVNAQVHFDNAPYTKPTINQVGFFARISQEFDAGSAPTATRLGYRRVLRRSGSLVVVVSQKLVAGSTKAWRGVDALVNSYTGCSVAGATFTVPIVTVLGVDADFWLVQVDCPFTVDWFTPAGFVVPELGV